MSDDFQVGYLSGLITALLVIAVNPWVERWRDRWLKPRLDASANRKVEFIREAPQAEVDAMFRRWIVWATVAYLSVVLVLTATLAVDAGWFGPVRWGLTALWALMTFAAWQVRRVYRQTHS